jgi:hypothetical protein
MCQSCQSTVIIIIIIMIMSFLFHIIPFLPPINHQDLKEITIVARGSGALETKGTVDIVSVFICFAGR